MIDPTRPIFPNTTCLTILIVVQNIRIHHRTEDIVKALEARKDLAVNTRYDGHVKDRVYAAADFAVRKILPAELRAVGRSREANAYSACAPVRDPESAKAVKDLYADITDRHAKHCPALAWAVDAAEGAYARAPFTVFSATQVSQSSELQFQLLDTLLDKGVAGWYIDNPTDKEVTRE